MTSPGSPTLLFAHGAGFCKDIWSPIIRRMQKSSLLQSLPSESFVSLDLPFHGANRDNSEAAQIDTNGPHVTHPANNAIHLASVELLREAQRIQSDGRSVIGIGHSMGAAALWKTETANPGTFDGLVLFEPIYGPPMPTGPNRPHNFMADVTLKREWKWPSRAAAVEYFETWKGFDKWDRESLACWIEGAIVPDDDTNAVVLACHRTTEAAVYCGGRLWLSEQEQAQNKCVTTFHSGSLTRLFHAKLFLNIARRNPTIYKMHEPMVGKSHLLVMEDPAACTEAILSDLKTFDCFKGSAARL
ncbi:hypothetical protein BBO99_00006887 [Phytophthora kernoviae]|uniref:AB hydrolase-1 domain-containing protein n=2 Tax=Phytophthora kernoviae TaxID=325452 RepID=A0A3R7G631_9STRA|nr:hypothetical protein G195_009326 [Phytophthora kernoviae 00238/432]KAG2515942.1 hypothetical protein JM16_006644 [Phytophthora kernoviae]KAG2519344.1 hypothetical protein JM18_006504 [Phytophthora kernoviae]RLN37876.1 hypothetical protein BBI17_008698 [Phytophthora kernoviae]RLN77258.1 hypothetical protein BBO99_00006887 [Phytophthora kernoviae]